MLCKSDKPSIIIIIIGIKHYLSLVVGSTLLKNTSRSTPYFTWVRAEQAGQSLGENQSRSELSPNVQAPRLPLMGCMCTAPPLHGLCARRTPAHVQYGTISLRAYSALLITHTQAAA